MTQTPSTGPSTYGAVLGLPLVHRGKVRELYAWPDDRLLMVATDAISAFDFVFDTPIPDKGAVLTQLSLWWFDQLRVPHHVLSTDVPAPVAGRAVICERLDMIAFECVARGFLTGSGWVEYQRSGTVCGIALPPGLRDGSELPEPIFTPATKAPIGEHDENVDFDHVVRALGGDLAEQIRALTLDCYRTAQPTAAQHGLILADTKVEFGTRPDGTVVLADEVLTPDSSRFWDGAAWADGRLESFDKQYLRDWLLHESGWDRAAGGPPPNPPAEVVAATRERYLDAFRRLSGRAFEATPVQPG